MDLIKDLELLFSIEINISKKELTMCYDAKDFNECEIKNDYNRIKSVLIHMIGNAIKFT